MMEHWRSAAARETARAVAALPPPSEWTGPVMRVLGGALPRGSRTPATRTAPVAALGLGSAVGFTALGAAAMYLLDPDRGAERREAVRAWLVQQWEARRSWTESAIEGMRPEGGSGLRRGDNRWPASGPTDDVTIAK